MQQSGEREFKRFNMSTSKDESLRSYNYACRKFGTKEMVRLRRNIYNIWDFIVQTNPSLIQISSGSAVEGLDMIGSDVDIMYLNNDIVVCISERDAENVAKITHASILIMDTDNTKPCYVLLRVPKSVPFQKINQSFLLPLGQDLFFSSQEYKLFLLNSISSMPMRFKIHGPCLTSEDDRYDLSLCFRCKCWPPQAWTWVSRSRSYWPSSKLISKIINFGVLFVPIGCKGSINENIEWRMSFSVAEKLLIYSFSHTQMLCYGLMKLLLKDIIDKKESLKGILCSYFLKTLLFWLCEESDKEMWKPENILSCFRACICRLLYCVQHSTLVHYFIPRNNLFECRFKKDDRIQIIGLLQESFKLGWQCFRVSGTFSGAFHTIYQPNHDSVGIHKMIWSLIYILPRHFQENENSLVMLNKIMQFSGVKLAVKLIMFLWAKSKNLRVQRSFRTFQHFNNKLQYNNFQQEQKNLLMSLHSEKADIGWLFVATFFYRHKMYHIVLELASHILSLAIKADLVSLEFKRIPVDTKETGLIYKPDELPAIVILHSLMHSIVRFEFHSSLIPDELDIEVTDSVLFTMDPIVLTYFLKFLSNYHLGDFMSCMESLKGLESNTHALYRYNLIGKVQLSSSFLCLGIAQEMIGNLDKAYDCFSTCVSFGKWNTTKAAFRLSKLYR